MVLVIIIFIVTFFIVYLIQNKLLFKNRYFLPPGPTPWPVVGTLLQIDKSDPRKTLLKWRQNYGPIYTVWSGSEPQVLVCDYKLMHEIFVKNGDNYTDRPPNWIFEYLLKGKCGIVFASGDRWKEQRRFTLQTLRNFGFGRQLMEEKILNEIKVFLTSIEDRLNVSETNIISLDEDIDMCVGNVISSLLVGRTYPKNDPTFRSLKTSLYQLFKLLLSFKFVALLYFPLLRYVPFFGHFGFDELMTNNRKILDIILHELEQHKQTVNNSEESNDFTSAYLREIERRTSTGEDLGFFSEWQLVCVMFDLWVAGMETAVPTIRWAFLLMIKYPEYQQKVRDEIDCVIGKDRLPTTADRNSMPYTQAVINEIQRFANIVPANFPRIVTKYNAIVDGYSIPKSTTIVPQISVTNNDEASFSNAHIFDPNHFLESDGKTLKKIDCFQPFSIGKRTCLGEGLARMELFLVFTSVLQRFVLKIPDNFPEPSLKPEVRFIMDPQFYECFIEKRN